ncbi:disulfide oxidoreductase [Jeotgalibacillus proteolyticus]|uniref:disulfide oxidoreductase n=1 Tax=Jeotgalibacillus proteolyticus TaxID=2082395 RepID=UPI003CF2570E
MEKKTENFLFTAWAASLVAAMGSLYFSEIRGYEPCELCWYQRIFMYPIVILLAAAIYRKDPKAAFYSACLSGIGGLVSIYHYGIQKLDFLSDSAPACGMVPCTGEYINWLGFITIPFLALTAFAIIFIFSLLILKQLKGEKA